MAENDKRLYVNIGKAPSGEIITADFSRYSNILVSGTVGSGKTGFVISLLLSLMFGNPPDRIKMVIYDSKRIDYSFMNSSRYLLTPIINDPRKFTRAAAILVEEAEKRLESGVLEDKPDIIFVIDDYADVASDDAGIVMQRLMNLSRVAKIHVIIVTATPSSSIIPTEIKAMIPYRIAFTTASSQASQMIIGQPGAEKLSYPGEFILKCGGNVQTYTSIYFQDPSLEMTKLPAGFSSSLYEYDEKIKNAIENIDQRIEEDPQDALTEDAISFILKAKQASVSMLQRRFRINYNRAARIIDEMEERGIIGPSDGSRPRQVLITEDEYYGSSNNSSAVPEITYEVSVEPMGKKDERSASDFFNSLPESVKRMILEADNLSDY